MRVIFKILKNIPIVVLDFMFLPIWKFCGIIRRKENLWIFVSWFGTKYNDSSRIFFEWINTNHQEINAIWLSRDSKIVKKIREKGYKAYNTKSLKAKLYTLKAKNIFTTTGYEMFYGFTNGANIIELWHGMPLKKILRDDEFSSAGLNKNLLYRILHSLNNKCFKWKNITTLPNLYTCTSSDFFTPFLRTAFGLDDTKILKTGLPRNDALFYNNKESIISDIRAKFQNCKIILYMPTFRNSSWTKKPFNCFSAEYSFDKEKFASVLSDNNLVFVYKPHFFDLEFIKNINISDRFVLIDDDSYDELYNFIGLCDVLITDYSSIYFDFIITKKEVILAPFDLENYLKTCRAQYFSYSEMIGNKASDWNELLNILANSELDNHISEEGINKFSQYSDGNSCQKLLDYLREIS